MHEEAKAAIGDPGGGNSKDAGAQPAVIRTVPLRPDHDVAAFELPKAATSSAVKDFLVEHASGYVEAQCSRVFVFENPEKRSQIWGFYSLSASVIRLDIIDKKLQAPAMGAMKSVPMALLGYMGRHDDDKLKFLGAGLLHDAAARASTAAENLGIWGIWLNAENDKLVPWYEKNNFVRALPVKSDQKPSKQMYAPLASLLGSTSSK